MGWPALGTAATVELGLTWALFGLIVAFWIDWLFGDPSSMPHPVVGIGKMIETLEKRLRAIATNAFALKLSGVVLVLVIVGGSYAVVWGALGWLERYAHPLLAWGVGVWLISTTIAAKGLADAGMDVYRWLAAGELDRARSSLAMVVGRDTDRLDESEIARGAVETVAENIVDAIVAPLFYAALGGAPLAMAYRATNTLDSMVGYKNERYVHFGWAAARLDDWANYIPARLAGALLVVVCFLSGRDARACWRVMRRDARLHSSPNSGFTEAGVAGALGIQLGGVNYYEGIPSERAKLGDRTRPIEANDIVQTTRLMKRTAIAALLCCLLIAALIGVSL